MIRTRYWMMAFVLLVTLFSPVIAQAPTIERASSPFILSQDVYNVGDQVIIRILETLESFTISDGQNTFKFLGEPGKSVAFTPQHAGTYLVRGQTVDGRILETSFIAIESDVPVVPTFSQEVAHKNILKVKDNTGAWQSLDAEITDFSGKIVDPSTEQVVQGRKYDLKVSPRGHPVNEIEFRDLEITQNLTFGLDMVDHRPIKIGKDSAVKAWAIDPTPLDFSNATVTFTATGTQLWKCAEWNFTTATCTGSWEKALDTVPGQDYSFLLTPDDPGYVEILITKAIHLDSSRTFLADITSFVIKQDGIWSPSIWEEEHVRVTFEKFLSERNDITIFVRNTQGLNTSVEVYLPDGTYVTKFPVISETGYYKKFLSGLIGTSDTFDLKVVNTDPEVAFIEFDHIIDPTAIYNPNSTILSEWSTGSGTDHTVIDEGTTPDTNDYLDSVGGSNEVSEFRFPPVTETGITKMTLFVHTSTSTNAEYTFELRQSTTPVCSEQVPIQRSAGWWNCTWSAPSGSFTNMTAYLGTVNKNGTGKPRSAVVNTIYLEVEFDNAPLVTLQDPGNDTDVLSKDVAFNFTVTDDVVTTLPNCSLYANFTDNWNLNRTIYNVANGSTTNITILDIPEGKFLWNVVCFDNLPQSAFAPNNYTFYVNTIPPAITNSAVNDTLVNQSYVININTTITDFFGINTAKIEIEYPDLSKTNYTLVRNSGTDNWEYNFTDTIQIGTYTLTLLWANDSRGQIGQNTSLGITFQVLGSPPTPFDLLTPTNRTVSSNLQPTMTWQATTDETFDNYTLLLDQDSGFGFPDFEYYNFNTVTNTTRLLDFALDANRVYYWRVVAYDTFSNSKDSNQDFWYITDTLPPSIVLNKPDDAITIATTTYDFNYTPDDANNIVNCSLYANTTGSMTRIADNSTLVTKASINTITGTLPYGVSQWTVTCYDEADNSNSSFSALNRTITVDIRGPDVTLYDPPDDTLETDSNTINFNVSTIDTFSGITSCELIINDVVEQTKTTGITEGVPFTFVEFLTNDQYNWSVNCTDTLGNENSSVEYNLTVLVVDTNPPLITPNYPGVDAFISSASVVFNFTPEDATGLENCSIYIDGAINKTNVTPENFEYNYFTVNGISEGQHNWQISCTDNSTFFNVGYNALRNFTIDTTPPGAFSLTAPSDETITTDTAVTMNWSLPSETNFENYTLLVDNNADFSSPEYIGENTNIGQPYNTTSPLADDIYFWKVITWDKADNSRESTQTWQFEVHTHAPTIENVTATPESPAGYVLGQLHYFNATIEEPLLDTAYIENNFSGVLQNDTPTGNVTLAPGIWNFYLSTELGAGTYRYRWFVNDTVSLSNKTTVYTYLVVPGNATVNLTLNSTDDNFTIEEDTPANLTTDMILPSSGYHELLVDGVVINSGSGKLENITVFNEPGMYNITTIYPATVNYSETRETHFLFVNDNTPPNVTPVSPGPGATIGSLDITFQYIVNDSSNIANCSIWINDTINKTNTSEITKEIAESFDITFAEGFYEWYVVCWDTEGNPETSETRNITVKETDAVLVFVNTDFASYENGSTVKVTTNTEDAFGNPVDSNVLTDIILGNTSARWWNSSWILRKPIYLNETGGVNVSEGVAEINLTGLVIGNCNEIRIVRNSTGYTTEVPFETYYSGTDWCYVAFRANATADGIDENNYHVYYNNSGAAIPSYTFPTSTNIIYYAQTAAADEGAPTGTDNIVGNNDSSSATITISGGGSGQTSAHGRDFINYTTNSLIQNVQVRYRFQVTQAESTWQLRYSVDNGTIYTNSFSGLATELKQTTSWHDITSQYNQLTWSDINSTRLQGRTTKGGGAATTTLLLYWVEMNLTVRISPDVTEGYVGDEQAFVDSSSSLTGPDGVWTYLWDSHGTIVGNYSAVSTASASGFNDGLDAAWFELTPDNTKPNVTLIDPPDFDERGVGLVTFQYKPFDINLYNCTLYFGSGGTFEPNETNSSPDNNITNSFTPVLMGIGLYDWNVLCWDTEGNSDFAPQNFTLNISGPDLYVQDLWFDYNELVEGVNITMFANISNQGLSDANQSFITKFYIGDPDVDGEQLNGNITLPDLNVSDVITINITYILRAGLNDIYLVVDTADSIEEADEGNNKANENLTVELYHYFYGNITAGILLDDSSNESFFQFGNLSSFGGYVLVTDTDASFSFSQLYALTRTEADNPTANDFTDADANLNSTSFNDSIKVVWGGGTDTPLQTFTINLAGRTILNVPQVNSTNTSSFRTGILWDAGDDGSLNDQYDTTDEEDLIFITPINASKVGSYGIYDYEIMVPKSLESYKGSDDSLTFYYEIT